ncbi:hypothetical protein Trydic_g9368 [Trypoxylus dichotomus]
MIELLRLLEITRISSFFHLKRKSHQSSRRYKLLISLTCQDRIKYGLRPSSKAYPLYINSTKDDEKEGTGNDLTTTEECGIVHVSIRKSNAVVAVVDDSKKTPSNRTFFCLRFYAKRKNQTPAARI